MAKFHSKPVTLQSPVQTVFDKISDIGGFQQRLEELPEDMRAKLGDVRFTSDSIIINAAPAGEMQFDVVERVAPSKLVLAAANAPVSFKIAVDLKPISEDSTEVESTIDVDIPAMMKPLVGGKLQEAADRFGDLIKMFAGGAQ